jgi:hypothetical protein
MERSSLLLLGKDITPGIMTLCSPIVLPIGSVLEEPVPDSQIMLFVKDQSTVTRICPEPLVLTLENAGKRPWRRG